MAIRNDNDSSPGSITKTADAQMDRIGNISNVSKTVSNMQKNVKQKITETRNMAESSKDISSIQNSMLKVLDKLGDTVAALSAGVKTVTIDTARATKEAISDYSKAISQDISFNKQNVVAMALAKSTPIYGYFVAKFMETDVFKRAAERMKQSIGNAFGSVAKLFRRGGRPEKDIAVPKELRGKNIPHMAKGGVVGKGGLAKLHAAEVVMPIDKILKRMDEGAQVSRNLSKIMGKMILEQAASTKNYQGMILHAEDRDKKEKRGIVKDFFRIWRQEKERSKEAIDVRQLRELISIREVLGGDLKIAPEVWSRLLYKHPYFRSSVAAAKVTIATGKLLFWKPFYFLLKNRGGYKKFLSKKEVPLEALNQNIGVLFTESMWRFDNMLNILKAIAEAARDTSAHLTGKKYQKLTGIGTGEWSIANSLGKALVKAYTLPLRALGMIPDLGGLGKIGRDAEKFLLDNKYTKSKKTHELLGTGEEKKKGLMGSITSAISSFEQKRIEKNLLNKQLKKEKKRSIKAGKKWDKYLDHLVNRLPKEKKEKKLMITYYKEQLSLGRRIKKYLTSKKWIEWLMYIWGILSPMLLVWKTKLFSFLGIKALGQGFLGSIFGKGGLIVRGISSLFSFVKLGISALWTVGSPILSWISGGFMTLVTSAPFWAALAAAGVGLAIGTMINEYIIKPIYAKMDKEWDKSKKSNKDIVDKARQEGMAASRDLSSTSDAAAFKNIKQTSLMSSMTGSIERKKSMSGFFGGAESEISAIDYAQGAYLNEHIGEYLNYDINEINALRQKWNENDGIRTRDFNETPDKYGRYREKRFLEYMKSNLKPLSADVLSSQRSASDMARRKAQIGEIGKNVQNAAGNLAESAKAGAQAVIIDASNYASTLNPKAKEAFETAKKFYIKEFGWSEEYANQVLMDLGTTSGNLIDTFKDTKKLKEFGISSYNNLSAMGKEAAYKGLDALHNISKNPEQFAADASKNMGGWRSTIQDKAGAFADKTKIVINEATIALTNGELMEGLGDKIVQSSKDLAEKTVNGTKAIVTTITNVNQTTSNSSNANVSSGGGGNGAESRDFFDRLLYTGNYR